MKLIVVTSNRYIDNNIKEYQQVDKKIMTIKEFFNRAIIVKEHIKLDKEQRILMLEQAIDKGELLKLGFEYNFLSFLTNSEFIFKFFDEINLENVNIDTLINSDTRAEYTDHIELLLHIHKKYKALLSSFKYFDKATISDYKININFLSTFSECEISVDGYLSAFEYNLIVKVSNIINTNIKISTTSYNYKMYEKFDLNLLPDKKYLLDLSNKKILLQEDLIYENKFSIQETDNRISQIFFIQNEIIKYVDMGIKPNEIAVILPDEKFADMIKSFDKKGNFNFAMGTSYSVILNFRILKSIYTFMIDNSEQNRQRLMHLDTNNLFNKILSVSNIDEFILFVEQNFADDEIIQNELFKINYLKNSFLKSQNIKNILKFFLDLLKAKRVDDISGGNITITGVLESRGILYKAIIVIDFNENIIPHINQKDIFLNSKIKKSCNLPTKEDRDNLQKHYYHMLFCNSQNISICYIKNEQNSISRFSNLIPNSFLKNKINGLRFKFFENNFKPISNKNIKTIDNCWQDSKLSASKLNLYLSCKRAFYYKYIKKIKEHKISIEPKAYEVGSRYHEILFDVFKNETFRSDIELKKLIKERLIQKDDSTLLRFDLNIWFNKLDLFLKNETKRKVDGYEVFALEKSFLINIEGINIEGQIDRIDIKDNKLYILDYKFKKSIKIEKNIDIDKITDYQLTIYYLATKELFGKDIDSVGFYDISNGKIIYDDNINEKIKLLKDVINIYKKDNLKLEFCSSQYCEYCKFKGF
jgi:CRISPR/Cas system-associated exonuclease Cas4 (RecB family)